jgi:hypothetical protein
MSVNWLLYLILGLTILCIILDFIFYFVFSSSPGETISQVNNLALAIIALELLFIILYWTFGFKINYVREQNFPRGEPQSYNNLKFSFIQTFLGAFQRLNNISDQAVAALFLGLIFMLALVMLCFSVSGYNNVSYLQNKNLEKTFYAQFTFLFILTSVSFVLAIKFFVERKNLFISQ